MSGYIHIGRQLPGALIAAPGKTFDKEKPQYLQQFGRWLRTLPEFQPQEPFTVLADGLLMVNPASGDWSDEALARLLHDVHRPWPEEVREQVESTPLVKPSALNSGREMVMISDVKQGDQIFDYGAPDSDAATVLYVYDGDYFTSCMVVKEPNAPFLIQRHSGAYIYRKVKP